MKLFTGTTDRKINNILMVTMFVLGIFGAGMMTAAMLAYTVCLPIIAGLVMAVTLAVLAITHIEMEG